jgi:transposase InsO family protein
MTFTMKYTAHPERRTAFQRAIEALGFLHGTIRKGCPWQNGIIERSNRTDNEELFHTMRFTNSEQRRYYLRLWEMHYNNRRPHQGIDGRIPLKVFQTDYRMHATCRMLT